MCIRDSLLVTPRIPFITVRINAYADNGNFGVACVYATVLILLGYAAIGALDIMTKKLTVRKTTI